MGNWMRSIRNQIRTKPGSKMLPKWYQTETKLEPIWDQTRTELEPVWDQTATNLGTKLGTKTGPAPVRHQGPKKCLKCITVIKNRPRDKRPGTRWLQILGPQGTL